MKDDAFDVELIPVTRKPRVAQAFSLIPRFISGDTVSRARAYTRYGPREYAFYARLSCPTLPRASTTKHRDRISPVSRTRRKSHSERGTEGDAIYSPDLTFAQLLRELA